MTAWVDDVMIVAPETMFENIMKMLEEEFLLKRGPLLSKGGSRYLGREWRRIGDEVQIRIDPKHFMETIEIGGMTGCKSVCTPEAVFVEQGGARELPDDHRKIVFQRGLAD